MRHFLLFALLISCTLSAQVPALKSVIQLGHPFGDTYADYITSDNNGNIISAGRFSGASDFDPGLGILPLQGSLDDLYILKQDAQGNVLWVRQIGGYVLLGSSERTTGLVVDDSSNIYVSGTFRAICNFSVGHGGSWLTPKAGFYNTAFVAKFNTYGELKWVAPFEGNNETLIRALQVDNMGNVHVLGSFWGSDTIDLDPGPDSSFFTTSDLNVGPDGFLLKLNASGSLVWAKQLAHTLVGASENIMTLSSTNEILITGGYDDIKSYTPALGVFNLSSTFDRKGFILKIDSSGNFSPTLKFGEIFDTNAFGHSISPNGIFRDSLNNIYIKGAYRGALDMDPGPGVDSISTNCIGNNGFFIAKYSAAGSLIWARGTPSCFEDPKMAITPAGHIALGSSFSDSIDLDYGSGVHRFISRGYQDGYISLLDSSGNWIWGDSFGGIYGESVRDLAFTSTGDLAVTGWFADSVDFDFGPGVTYKDVDNWTHTYVSVYTPDFNPTSGIGLWEEKTKGLLIYPNPSKGTFTVNLGRVYPQVEVVVRNLQGQALHSFELEGVHYFTKQLHVPSGAYFIELHTGQERTVTKLIVD